jgi:rhodanese-related sulfurtransferase
VKFIIDNWTLILVALTSGTLLAWPVLKSATGGDLTPTGAVQLINREKAVVIDVCEAAEFALAHIGGSKNIPLGQLKEKLAGVVKNKELPLIFVCQTGRRSSSAASVARGLGYLKAQSLNGGVAAWQAANLPIDKA